MKRASLPLFLTLLAASGLALWLYSSGRPREDSQAAPAPEALESAGLEHTPPLEQETTAEDARTTASALATESRSAAAASSESCKISGWVWRRVEREREVVADMTVRLWAAAADGSFAEESNPLAEATSSPFGCFRFRDLARGIYFVAVQRLGGARHLVRVELTQPGAWETIDFLLGSARIDGVADSIDGSPPPMLELEPIVPHRRAEQRWPGEQGRFAFEDLPAGLYEIRARWHVAGPSTWREESLRLEFTDGQVHHCDFGATEPLPRWTGRVTVVDGLAVRPDAVLRFESSESQEGTAGANQRDRRTPDRQARPLSEDERKRVVRAGVDVLGRFEVVLPARGWVARLEVDSFERRTLRLGEGDLADSGLCLDLRCPGSRIQGHALGRDGFVASKGARVAAYKKSEGYGRSSCATVVDARGEFVLDGVEPGSWELYLEDLPKGWSKIPASVRVADQDRVIEQDLHVRAP